ncbi:MAG: hypothetical protein M3R07_04640 [Gemmatimonadota bacterium]|nr:hypothetical protein [Gemmatimonadota bacterium]
MTTDQTYREAHRRQHKLLGTYLALWSWKHGVDAVIVQREQLLSYLELERMQDKRVDWLKDDIKSLFPDAWTTVDSKSNVYSTLYLSRRAFPHAVKTGSMSDQKRLDAFGKAGMKAAVVKVPKEAEIVRILAGITHGILDFPDETATRPFA